MKYAIIVWVFESDVQNYPGIVYSWYEKLSEAVDRAMKLQKDGSFFKATVMKIVLNLSLHQREMR